MLRTAVAATSAAVVIAAAFIVSGIRDDSTASAATSAPTTTIVTANSYASVASALAAGRHVEVTTELEQCVSTDGKPGPGVTGGLQISAFQIVQGQFIAFSDTHQTLDPSGASVTEFIRYQVSPDGATTVATTTLSASDQVLSTVQLNCRIGKGVYFHWMRSS